MQRNVLAATRRADEGKVVLSRARRILQLGSGLSASPPPLANMQRETVMNRVLLELNVESNKTVNHWFEAAN